MKSNELSRQLVVGPRRTVGLGRPRLCLMSVDSFIVVKIVSHLQEVSKGAEVLATSRVCVQAVSGYTGPLSWWAW